MPVCPICNAKLAGSDAGYRSHIKKYHAVVTNRLQQKVIPVKSSARTKAQIIAALEEKLARYIIDPKAVACNESCRCNRCFQAKLDALLSRSTEALNDSTGDSFGRADGDKL